MSNTAVIFLAAVLKAFLLILQSYWAPWADVGGGSSEPPVGRVVTTRSFSVPCHTYCRFRSHDIWHWNPSAQAGNPLWILAPNDGGLCETGVPRHPRCRSPPVLTFGIRSSMTTLIILVWNAFIDCQNNNSLLFRHYRKISTPFFCCSANGPQSWSLSSMHSWRPGKPKLLHKQRCPKHRRKWKYSFSRLRNVFLQTHTFSLIQGRSSHFTTSVWRLSDWALF